MEQSMKYNIQTMAKVQASHEPFRTPPEHTWLGAADPSYCYPSRPHLYSRVTPPERIAYRVTYCNSNLQKSKHARAFSSYRTRRVQKFARKT